MCEKYEAALKRKNGDTPTRVAAATPTRPLWRRAPNHHTSPSVRVPKSGLTSHTGIPTRIAAASTTGQPNGKLLKTRPGSWTT